MSVSTWNIHNLKLSDSNKHRYHVLTCSQCGRLALGRTDHLRANEIRACSHIDREVRLKGINWSFVGR